MTIDGGAGDDTFYVKAWNGVGTLDGGADDDKFVFGTFLSAPAGSTSSPSGDGLIAAISQNHQIIGGGGNDTLVLDDSGSSAAVNYDVDNSDVKVDHTTPSPFGGVNFDTTLENVIVFGSKGKNVFSVLPNPKTAITIDGNTPTVAPGDELDINLSGVTGAKLAPNGPNGGTVTFTSGQKPITFSNIESSNPDLNQLQQSQQQQQQQNQLNTLLTELQTDPLLVVAAEPGSGSAPLVKLYDLAGGGNKLLMSFYAYPQFNGKFFTGGVHASLVYPAPGSTPYIVVAPGAGAIAGGAKRAK